MDAARRQRADAERREAWTVEAVRARQRTNSFAVVLCPGPSLADTWKREPGAQGRPFLTIAVNGAINFTRCDWLVALDREPLRQARSPREGILTKREKRIELQAGGLSLKAGALPELVWSTDVLPHRHDCAGALRWSRLAAITLAAHLGATSIDVYGDDRTGSTYWDGEDMPLSVEGALVRPDRWEKEAKDDADVMAFLRERGVDVTRVLPRLGRVAA